MSIDDKYDYQESFRNKMHHLDFMRYEQSTLFHNKYGKGS